MYYRSALLKSCASACLFCVLCNDVWSLFSAYLGIRHLYHTSVIPLFNIIPQFAQETKGTFITHCEVETWEGKWESFGFSDLSVSCEWSLECQDFTLPFSHKISVVLCLFFLICSSFPPKDLVPGHDMPNYLRYQLCNWQCIVSL